MKKCCLTISNIPESVYLRALELMNKPFETGRWTPRDAYNWETTQMGFESGELVKAICEYLNDSESVFSLCGMIPAL
jgi:hypothetical protein